MTAPAGATGLALKLSTGVLSITLLGGSNINVTGNTLANVLTGNSGQQQSTGRAATTPNGGAGGNDTLDGGAGIDTAVYSGALPQSALIPVSGGR